MEHVRKSTYWLILPILMIVVLVLSLAAAPTQSRYTTVAGWQMTLSQTAETLECDLLTEAGQKIRLQDMTVDAARQIPLTFTAAGDAEKVSIAVESLYLTASAVWTDSAGKQIEAPKDIFSGETLTCTLTLAANEAAQTVTDPTEASLKLTVAWDGGTLQGEFLTLLSPAEKQEEAAADTVSTDENSDASDSESQGNITENAENTEETDQTQTENTEIQTAAEDAAEDTTTEDTTIGGDTIGTETAGDTTGESASPEVGTWLSCMTNFAPDGVLPLLMTVPEGCEEITLALAVGSNAAGEFPRLTRYSTDEGASYTLLYDAYAITLTPAEEQTATVLLDFSAVKLSEEEVLSVTASALLEDEVFAVSTVTAQPTQSIPCVQWDADPAVLTAGQTVQFEMPTYGDSYTVKVSPLKDEQTTGLPVVSVTDDSQVIVSSDAGAAKPGTYRVVLAWSWCGIQVARQEFNVYVNYTPYVTIP